MIDQSFRYSRHLHSGVERIYTNRGSQIVIHAVIRSPKNHRRMQNEDDINNSRDLHSVSSLIATFKKFICIDLNSFRRFSQRSTAAIEPTMLFLNSDHRYR